MKKLFVTFVVALFATVVLGQTRTELKPGDLPQCVKDYIHQNMLNFGVDKAFRIENKLEGTYEVTVSKGKEVFILTFDNNCKLIKKVIPDTKKNPDNGNVPPNRKHDQKTTPPVQTPSTGPEKVAPKK